MVLTKGTPPELVSLCRVVPGGGGGVVTRVTTKELVRITQKCIQSREFSSFNITMCPLHFLDIYYYNKSLVILVCRESLVLSSHFLCSSLLIGSSKTDHKLLSHLATHNCICNHLNSTEVQLKLYTKIFNYWFFQQRPILHHE